ncbi:hypothetical protein KBD45_01255 [Candidatus Dojkabacteria bacterium]|nr:hypothetical protein [Candidatus Dojkabacteria bacterium]
MIYFVIPQLIEQPTWGGSYIADLKGISKYFESKNTKIGQSQELSNSNFVVPAKDVEKLKTDKLPFMLKRSNTNDIEFVNKIKSATEISKLDLKQLFGRNRKPDILIKFTQAKGNSYQIHPGVKTEKYRPKAESWYFFEKGRATLGIKPGADIELYKATLEHIYLRTQEISKQVKKKQITLEEAKKEMKSLLEIGQPINFVNYIKIETNYVVENYIGGLHHSWEENDAEIPNGNILYEVQKDIPDKECIIRAFDKGKLLDDGSYRELDIENYFKYLDTSSVYNEPQRYIKKPIILKETASYALRKVFDNTNYQADELNVFGLYDVEELGFRHLFVRSGEGTLKTEDQTITLRKGWSYLISSDIKEINIKKDKASKELFKIILTYLPHSLID